MRKSGFIRILLVLVLMGVCVRGEGRGFDETVEGGRSRVQRLNADPSPRPDVSNINNYINQDEQLNLTPRDGVVKILRTDQKIMLNDFESAVFPLHNATARELRNLLRTVVGIEGGRVEAIVDKETNQSFIQVIAPREMIPFLGDAIAALDVAWLKDYWDGGQDVYYKAQHRDAEDIDRIAEQYGGDDGFTVIDRTNNAIRRYDDEYRQTRYAEGAAIVDIPANQVLLDVKMYEVNTNNDTKLGLDFIAWKNGPGRNLFQFVHTALSADQRAGKMTSVFDPFLDARAAAPVDTDTVLDAALVTKYAAVNYLITSNYVDYLQSKGRARLVNSQQLMVASSRTATLTGERQVLAIVNNENEIDTVAPDRPTPFIVRRNTGNELDRSVVAFEGSAFVTESTFNPSGVGFVEDARRRVNLRSAGVVTTELTVTPYVGLESMELEIDLEIDDVSGVAPSGLPIINKRTVGTTVRLLDGQPYVISGIKRSTNSKNTAKVPVLGSIPVLGWAFGGETNLQRESRVVVVITPHFVLASQRSIAPVPEVELAKAIVGGEAPLPLPENAPGYDQWLLGRLGRNDE